MKVLNDSWLSNGYTSTGSILYQIGDKRVKMIYECGNAFDRFTIQIFDGDKFNTVATMSDLGVKSDTSMYIKQEAEVFDKFNQLLTKGKQYIKNLLS